MTLITIASLLSTLKMSGLCSASKVKEQIVDNDIVAAGGYPWCRIIDLQYLKKYQKLPLFNTDLIAYEDKHWVFQVLDEIPLTKVLAFYRLLSVLVPLDVQSGKENN